MSSSSGIDQQKVQKLLTEAANSSKSSVAVVMDVETVALLTEYADSIASSILEGSIALSQAKRSTLIDESDIALLLQKKLGEEVAGKYYPHPLHSQAIKSSISSNLVPEEVEQIARRRNKYKS